MIAMTGPDVRDFEREAGQFGDRRYNYDFDAILRRYMMRAFDPFMPAGRALELERRVVRADADDREWEDAAQANFDFIPKWGSGRSGLPGLG